LNNKPKYLIVIAGPTAVGKTDVSIEIAKHVNTQIISADSRQFYKELQIGAAPPTHEQLETVNHHFVGHKSITDYYNVSIFEQDVLQLLPGVFHKTNCVILTGGSGMYIDAVCNGIDDMPDHDPELRQQLTERLDKEGVESLRLQLKQLDPASYSKVDLKNKNRVFRALEMCLQTGKPYSQFLLKSKKERPFNIVRIGINLDRAILHDRINRRVDLMMEKGLENEAHELYKFRSCNALKTVGYKEMFEYFDGMHTREAAIELIKRNTRRYARRQLTWFNRNNDYEWFAPEQVSEMISFIENKISIV
jgi:tRNA dimethylallyltransferase